MRVIALRVLTFVVVGIVAGTAFLLATSRGKAAKPATFSVLERQPTSLPRDKVTPRLRELGVNSDTDPRLALERNGVRYFVVPAPHKELCLVIVKRSVTANTCLSGLNRDDAMWLSHPKAGGVMDVYGVVSDEVTSVSIGMKRTEIVNNVFVLEDVPITELLVLSGSGVSRTIDMGQQIPPGVTIGPEPE